MGNLIITDSIVKVANSGITARNENPGDWKYHTMIHTRPELYLRLQDANANDYLAVLDFGAEQSLAAIALLGINASKIQIQGHTADSWGSPASAGTALTVSQETYTGLYNIFVTLSGWSYQFLRIFIPTGATEVGTSISKWQVSSIVPLSAATPLTVNMDYGFSQTAEQAETVNRLAGGGMDAARLSASIKWKGTFPFGKRTIAQDAELRAMNRFDISQPVVLFMNNGVTSECHLCKRMGSYTSRQTDYGHVEGSSISFEEW